MQIAVITGASSGLGEAYVRSVVAFLPNLDEIWLIARRADRLEAIAAAHPEQTFRCLPLDLTDPQAMEVYRRALTDTNATVRVLINNAGYGKLGNFDELDTEAQCGMVDLNCRALTATTAETLPHMSRGGGILNVSSIASFAPTTRMAVYCSTKAYVSSLSKALRVELRPRGINVLAVCPGPMATEFIATANITGRSRTFETLPYCQPQAVADGSLRRLLNGRGWYTNRGFYKFYRVLAKVLPHSIVMKFCKT